MPASGGEPEALTTLDAEQGETAHVWPQILPGSEAVLFTIAKGAELELAVLSLATGEIRALLLEGSRPRYAASGHLVYGVDGTLRAVPFDLERLAVTGDAVPVLAGVVTKDGEMITEGDPGGVVNFDLSRDGRLVYIAGGAIGGTSRSLVWVDRDGREEVITAPLRAYRHPRISPGGEKVALEISDQEMDVFIWDFALETLRRLTFSAELDRFPVWMPDGERIFFYSARDGSHGIYLKDGFGSRQRCATDGEPKPPVPHVNLSRRQTPRLLSSGCGRVRGSLRALARRRAWRAALTRVRVHRGSGRHIA